MSMLYDAARAVLCPLLVRMGDRHAVRARMRRYAPHSLLDRARHHLPQGTLCRIEINPSYPLPTAEYFAVLDRPTLLREIVIFQSEGFGTVTLGTKEPQQSHPPLTLRTLDLNAVRHYLRTPGPIADLGYVRRMGNSTGSLFRARVLEAPDTSLPNATLLRAIVEPAIVPGAVYGAGLAAVQSLAEGHGAAAFLSATCAGALAGIVAERFTRHSELSLAMLGGLATSTALQYLLTLLVDLA